MRICKNLSHHRASAWIFRFRPDFRTSCEKHGIQYPYVKMKVMFEFYVKFCAYIEELGSPSCQCVDLQNPSGFPYPRRKVRNSVPRCQNDGHIRILSKIWSLHAKFVQKPLNGADLHLFPEFRTPETRNSVPHTKMKDIFEFRKKLPR